MKHITMNMRRMYMNVPKHTHTQRTRLAVFTVRMLVWTETMNLQNILQSQTHSLFTQKNSYSMCAHICLYDFKKIISMSCLLCVLEHILVWSGRMLFVTHSQHHHVGKTRQILPQDGHWRRLWWVSAYILAGFRLNHHKIALPVICEVKYGSFF